jgi:NADH-quinone oxidoreductase subunit H
MCSYDALANLTAIVRYLEDGQVSGAFVEAGVCQGGSSALMAMAVFPFSKQFQAFDINIGVFFLIAISSIGVIGILLAGWSSNNKYALIGAMRSGLQTISYELSVGLSILTMVLLTGTLQLSEIIEAQRTGGWLILQGHVPSIIAFMIFMIAGTAETNRAPFDLVEAESELGAGSIQNIRE